MKNLLKISVAIIVLFIIVLVIKNAPKGSDYINYEKQMILSSQMNVENSQYFILTNGKLTLK